MAFYKREMVNRNRERERAREKKNTRFCKMYNNVCLVANSTATNGRFTLQIGVEVKETMG